MTNRDLPSGDLPARDFDATVEALTGVMDRCAAAEDRAGYFAAMYLAVTRLVRERIDTGGFEDGERMGRFVATFAARYLVAEEAWRSGEVTSDSWRIAFETTTQWRPVILQHLLLGMNAHINLDLGVTVAELGDVEALAALRADFDAINDVLATLVDGSQDALGQVSPWCKLIDRLSGPTDEAVINFSLVAARRHAWDVATQLAALSGSARAAAIIAADAEAARVARRIVAPGIWPSSVLLVVRLRERANPSEVMQLLAAVTPAVS